MDIVSEEQDREPTEEEARRNELTRRYGRPEPIAAADALVLARYIRPGGLPEPVRADQVHASIYRDKLGADGWLVANKLHHGHPEYARVTLPDGRVVGILDLRPALARAAGLESEGI